MYKAKSRRKQLVQRVAVSIIMTVLVIVMSVILLFLMLGYRFSKADNSITQGGLVQFRSTPSDATVTAGSAVLSNKTPSKITLLPGDYTVKMDRQGYHTWQKEAAIKAGTVLWLNSARLVPTQLTTTTVASLGNLADSDVAPNRRQIATLASAASPTITLIDTSGETVTTRDIGLAKTDYLTGKNHRFSLEGYVDNEALLLRHETTTANEWLIVRPKDNSAEVETLRLPKQRIKKTMVNSGNTNTVVLVATNGDVRTYSRSQKKLSPVLVKNVQDAAFITPANVAFAAKTKKNQISTGYVTITADNPQPRTITTIRTSQPVNVEGHEYYGDTYLVTAIGATVEVRKYGTLPASDDDAPLTVEKQDSLRLNDDVTFLSQQAGGRFVVMQSARSQSIYDLELYKQSDVSVERDNARSQLEWIDGYNFVMTTKKKLQLVEYDGTNRHDIASSSRHDSVALSPNEKYLYGFSQTADGVVLQRTTMILD